MGPGSETLRVFALQEVIALPRPAGNFASLRSARFLKKYATARTGSYSFSVSNE